MAEENNAPLPAFRNAQVNEYGTIDCEIEHPVHGWIPFTCDPNDTGAPLDASALFLEMVSVAAAYEPPPPELVAENARRDMQLTFAQLLIGLVSEEWITPAEGRAWRDRVSLPDVVVAMIATLPPEHQFAAETRILAPSVVLRTDPLVSALAEVQERTPEEIDQFFLKYAGV
jgi:hypothetical protein